MFAFHSRGLVRGACQASLNQLESDHSEESMESLI